MTLSSSLLCERVDRYRLEASYVNRWDHGEAKEGVIDDEKDEDPKAIERKSADRSEADQSIYSFPSRIFVTLQRRRGVVREW